MKTRVAKQTGKWALRGGFIFRLCARSRIEYISQYAKHVAIRPRFTAW
jgi:hypothetical protein